MFYQKIDFHYRYCSDNRERSHFPSHFSSLDSAKHYLLEKGCVSWFETFAIPLETIDKLLAGAGLVNSVICVLVWPDQVAFASLYLLFGFYSEDDATLARLVIE